MAEPGWPLIPREVLPAPVRPRPRTGHPSRRPHAAPSGRQLSIFGAETTEPSPADLAGLLAGPGRLGRMGGTARVSVRVDAAWRVHVLVAELVGRGLVVQWLPLGDDDEVRRGGAPPESGAPPHSQDVESATEPATSDDDPGPPPANPGTAPPANPGNEPAAPPAKRGTDVAAPPAKRGTDVAGPPAKRGTDVAGPPAKRGTDVAGPPAKRGTDPAGPPARPGTDAAAPPAGAPRPESPDDGPGAGGHDRGASGDEAPGRPGPGVAVFEVRTAYSSRLNGLARAWPAAADQLFLSGPRLRLWVAAAGAPVDGGYALALDPDKSVMPVDSALRRVGLHGSVSEDGLAYLITGRKRLARLAELVGDRPEAAPRDLWPDGASA